MNISEHSQSAATQPWRRWLVVPVAAVGGAAIGTFLLGLLQWVGMKTQWGFSETSWVHQHVEPVFLYAMFGWLYIRLACTAAPTRKLAAGAVMAALLLAVLFADLAYVWFASAQHFDQAIATTVGYVASLVAAAIALAQAHYDYGGETAAPVESKPEYTSLHAPLTSW